ncbi:MAG: nucleotidyltransferase family protein [Clostridia bacterium]|nr:nucleotidyltransferase family protein [Clostridia bacterium]
MFVCAIICEYNPFHRGHEIQIGRLRDMFPDACILSLQSGNFVQRGETAVIYKYRRAEAAVKCGADLVLELPFPWCAQGAHYFARAGVDILNSLGADLLCFGSETGDLQALTTAAKRMNSPEFIAECEKEEAESMESSVSHIASIRSVYKKLYGSELPIGANDTLGIEYLKSIAATESRMKPICIRREGGYTATLSREYYKGCDFDSLAENVPEKLVDFYREIPSVSTDSLGPAILNFFRTHTPEELSVYADLGGGLAGRLCRAANEAADYAGFCNLAATKKYTNARIRRAILSAMLRVTEDSLKRPPRFTSLLAANGRGTAFLRSVKKTADIEILTRPAAGKALEGEAADQFALSYAADTLWALAAGIAPNELANERPYIVK